MNNIILTLAIAFSLQGCSQEKKEINKNAMNTKYPKINSNNIEQKLFESVQNYPTEPMYYMRLAKSNCVIEVLVNDFPIYKSYELSNLATPWEINHAILKNGEQKLTYRLYPIGNLIAETYDSYENGKAIVEKTITTLTDLTAVSINIIKMDKKKGQKLEDEEVVMEHSSATKEGKFIASGKPYYEYTFTFNAQVPYENEGWSKGQDLRKLDPKLLEKKAVEFYQEYGKLFEKKDKSLLASLNFGHEKRNAIAYYKNQKDIKELWDEYLYGLKINNVKVLPIENYSMVFFGDGKIVFLLLNSLKESYRGGGALIIDSDEAIDMPGIYLYLPEGKRLEDGLYMID